MVQTRRKIKIIIVCYLKRKRRKPMIRNRFVQKRGPLIIYFSIYLFIEFMQPHIQKQRENGVALPTAIA